MRNNKQFELFQPTIHVKNLFLFLMFSFLWLTCVFFVQHDRLEQMCMKNFFNIIFMFLILFRKMLLNEFSTSKRMITTSRLKRFLIKWINLQWISYILIWCGELTICWNWFACMRNESFIHSRCMTDRIALNQQKFDLKKIKTWNYLLIFNQNTCFTFICFWKLMCLKFDICCGILQIIDDFFWRMCHYFMSIFCKFFW